MLHVTEGVDLGDEELKRSVQRVACLSRGTTDLPRRFFQAAARPIRQAWQLAPAATLLCRNRRRPPLATRLFNGYVGRVLTAAESDVAAFNQFARVTTLVDPATRLLRPAIMWRAATANYRGRQCSSQPAEPDTLVDSADLARCIVVDSQRFTATVSLHHRIDILIEVGRPALSAARKT
jgi:hypothetical protein